MHASPSFCCGLAIALLFAIAVNCGGKLASAAPPAVASNLDDESSSPETEASASLAGPRAFSRAFRLAARKATPAVVTILSYGQPITPAVRAAGVNDAPDPTQTMDPDDLDGADNAADPGTPELNREAEKKRLSGIGSGVIISA